MTHVCMNVYMCVVVCVRVKNMGEKENKRERCSNGLNERIFHELMIKCSLKKKLFLNIQSKQDKKGNFSTLE